MRYHNPVLLNKCISALSINPKGVYVDVTFGGGGHSSLILDHLTTGKLFAFDQDNNVNQNKLQHRSFKLINANFRYIKKFLKMEGVSKIDGLLADLGVSSYHLDSPKRGFSIRFNSELDMRMNVNSELSAKEIINEYSEDCLSSLFYNYGDLKNSRKIAKAIVVQRKKKMIATTFDLISIVSSLVGVKKKNQFLARVFQAIRIEVNDEIGALKEMLYSAVELLDHGGRLVVLSYHSVEDRIVKNLFKRGNTEGYLEKDFFGNSIKVLREINKKVIIPADEELAYNSRSKSAKLRIAEKI